MKYIVCTDIHGCFDELVVLLNKVGWILEPVKLLSGPIDDEDILLEIGGVKYFFKSPEGEHLVCLGDLNDRGPGSDKVIELFIQLQELGVASAISGNHDNKLMRYLKGNPVNISHGLEKTIEQLDARGEEFKKKVFNYLESLPWKFECPEFIGVHAAYKEYLKEKSAKQVALYGEVDRGAGYDENGYPIRMINWMDKYSNSKPVIFGHIVHDQVTFYPTKSGHPAIALDTGGVFGKSLSALTIENKEIKIYNVPCQKYHESSSSNYKPEYDNEQRV